MEIAQKHIVLLTPGFPKDERDDTCIPALQIFAKRLQKLQHCKVTVVAIHYPSKKIEYVWNGIKVYSLGFKKMFLGVKKRSVFRVLETIHEKQKISVLHSFWLGECAYYGHYFSKKHRLKHLTTLMGQDAKKGNKFVKKLPSDCMQLITLSAFQQDLFYTNYGVKTKIIPWGVEKFEEDYKEKYIDIIGVGSLINLKNYTAFIETILLLQKEFPAIRSVLVGEGKQAKQLQKLVKQKQLQNNITFTGKLPYDETQKQIARSKILLHPSHYESFGMVFAEAMAHKAYIVSQKTGIAQESMFWKTGNSIQQFASFCKEFLTRKNQLIASGLSIEDTVSEYVKCYYNEK